MGTQLPIYVVNLARRPDRLAYVAAQLEAQGLSFEAFEAIDASLMPREEVDRHFAATSPLGALAPGDKCCTLTHRALWRRLAQSGVEAAIVLEDDARLSAGFARFARDAAWVPPGASIVRFERWGNPRQLVAFGPGGQLPDGYRVRRFFTRNLGTAGYLITRKGAALLAADQALLDLPVDHLLFNPGHSPRLFRALAPMQLTPAVLNQDFQHLSGDIDRSGAGAARRGFEVWRRQLRNRYRDAKVILGLIPGLLIGRRRLQTVPMAPEPVAVPAS